MLTFNGIQKEHQAGMGQLEALAGDELDAIRHYSNMVAKSLFKQGIDTNVPVVNMILNGVRAGIALGLRISIEGGEVEARE